MSARFLPMFNRNPRLGRAIWLAVAAVLGGGALWGGSIPGGGEAWAQAQGQYPPWGYGGPYAPPAFQYRPQESSNARGVPPTPSYGQQPGAVPPPTTQGQPMGGMPPALTYGQPPGPMPPAAAYGQPPGALPPQSTYGQPPGAMPYGYPSPVPGPWGGYPPPAPPTAMPWTAPPASVTSPPPSSPATGQAQSWPPATSSPSSQAPAKATAEGVPASPAHPQAQSAPPTMSPGAVSAPLSPGMSGFSFGTPPGWGMTGPGASGSPYAGLPGSSYGSPWGQGGPGATTGRTPRLEVELKERQPYVQENVLLHLRVVSDQNLATATPELTSTNDLIVQKLDSTKAGTRGTPDGRREVLTEFVYVLTPLRAGDVSLPPLKVTGETASDAYGFGRQRFEATGGEGTRLEVRPALSSVQPWLPLRSLVLKASLDGGEEIRAGEPVALVLELRAVGAMGNQLPSLEPLLVSPDYRVYREQTHTEAKVSPDGDRLEGARIEHYTLVPRDGGRVRLPEIRIPWYNVATGSRDWASLPLGLGGSNAAGDESLLFREDAGFIWLSLAALLLPLLGFGIGLWYRGRLLSPLEPGQDSIGARLGRGARAAAVAAGRGWVQVRGRLHPAPVLARLRLAQQRLLPASSRFLSCLSAANREQDPAIWARRFQDQACRLLPSGPLRAQPGSLPGLAGQLQRLRPGADPAQLSRLLRQLDGALYGGQDIDFPRWKKEFARQLSRTQGLLGYRHRPLLRVERPRLPELNPRPSS